MAGRAMLVAGLTIGWPLLQLLILFVRFGENALVNVQDEIAPYVFFGFLSGTFLSYALRRADGCDWRFCCLTAAYPVGQCSRRSLFPAMARRPACRVGRPVSRARSGSKSCGVSAPVI